MYCDCDWCRTTVNWLASAWNRVHRMGNRISTASEGWGQLQARLCEQSRSEANTSLTVSQNRKEAACVVWWHSKLVIFLLRVVALAPVYLAIGCDLETRQTKREFLRIARRLEGSDNDFVGTWQVDALRRRLDQRGLLTRDEVDLRRKLNWHLLRFGDAQTAAEQIEAALKIAPKIPDPDREIMATLHFRRGITYLRQAEISNCISRHNSQCCIFPLQGGGIHTNAEPTRQAKQAYLDYLKIKPDDLCVRWLLNLVSMALEDYPDGVPKRFLIPLKAFESDYDVGRFIDIAPKVGVDTFNLCGGVIVDDFDGDNLLDIVTSTFDPRGPLTYYRRVKGQFEDASAPSRLDEQLGGLNCLGGDYDNDGDVDVLVLRGAWLMEVGRIRNSLLRNNGDGTFVDVTRRAGLAKPAYPTQAAAWGDFDNDGDLDLYIGNEGTDGVAYPSQLFRNNGDSTFTDIAEEVGVANNRYAKGVTAGDYDNDGDLDIYVSNIGPNRLYRNNGDGTFTDVAGPLAVTKPDLRSFATWFFDYDNDGHLDLFVAAYDADPSDVAADYLGLAHQGTSPCLYHNDGNGRFSDIATQVGLGHAYLPMGANFGDLDNDGYLDIYLATGDPGYDSLMPNVMLRNDGGQRFQDVTQSGGFGHLQKGHGVAFADIDNDGDQDIYNQLGGFYSGDGFHNALFLNPGHGNHWVTIQLNGITTNRSGVGARIAVVVNTPEGERAYHRAVGCGSSFGGSPLRQEIGLGSAESIERVEVRWPTSGMKQVFTDVPLDCMIRITEGTGVYQRVPLKKIELR